MHVCIYLLRELLEQGDEVQVVEEVADEGPHPGGGALGHVHMCVYMCMYIHIYIYIYTYIYQLYYIILHVILSTSLFIIIIIIIVVVIVIIIIIIINIIIIIIVIWISLIIISYASASLSPRSCCIGGDSRGDTFYNRASYNRRTP